MRSFAARMKKSSGWLRPALGMALMMTAQIAAGQINVADGQSALNLAAQIAGAGVTVSNAQLTCPSQANGIFQDGGASVGLTGGIVLTTGRALTTGSAFGINGPASANANINNGAPGDPQLAALANNTTLDACILEFDLAPQGDSVRFDYVFASEEYNNATCGPYNDAFAFFISGPGIAGAQNMALVPGTTIPVTVNSINNGIPGSSGNIANCTSMGAGSPFTAYYVDNSSGSSITYRGFTTVLKATHAVQPCATYHLRLSIADAGNALYDSGVFIRAGSLSATAYSISAAGATPGSTAVVAGCGPGTFTIQASGPGAGAQTVHYLIGGTAANGTDYAPIADSVVIPAGGSQAVVMIDALAGLAGASTVTLYLLSPAGCGGTGIADSATLTLFTAIKANILTNDTTVCRGTTIGVAAEASPYRSYSWSPASAFANPALPNTTLTANAAGPYVLTVTQPGTNCPAQSDTLRIALIEPPVADAGADLTVCTGAAVSLIGSASPDGSYTYQWQGPGGFGAVTPQAGFADATPGQSGAYVLTVGSAMCPPVTDTVIVTVRPVPPAPDLASPRRVCIGSVIPPLVSPQHQYLFYEAPIGGAAADTPTLPSTATAGTHLLYVSDEVEGCESERGRLEISIEPCCAGTVIIPTAFSPNGDGRNDQLRPLTDPATVLKSFEVYDRWGAVVFSGRSNDAWDGRHNGILVEIGTYYYLARLECRGRQLERIGEVAVVR